MPNKPPSHNQAERDANRKLRDQRRGNARQRGYSTAWEKESRAYRRDNPLCVRCKVKGKIKAAAVVDHIKPAHLFPELFMDSSNWQSLCQSCNAIKAQEDDQLYGPQGGSKT